MENVIRSCIDQRGVNLTIISFDVFSDASHSRRTFDVYEQIASLLYDRKSVRILLASISSRIKVDPRGILIVRYNIIPLSNTALINDCSSRNSLRARIVD